MLSKVLHILGGELVPCDREFDSQIRPDNHWFAGTISVLVGYQVINVSTLFTWTLMRTRVFIHTKVN